MNINFVLCESDEHFEKYARFMIENRQMLNFHSEYLIYTLCNQFCDGNIMIVLNEDENIVAAVTYFFGTAEEHYVNTHVLYIETAIMLEEYRSSTLFIEGFKFLLDFVLDKHEHVTEVRFNADENNDYLNRLYSKFAKPAGRELNEAHNLHLNIYSNTFRNVVAYVNKLIRRIK